NREMRALLLCSMALLLSADSTVCFREHFVESKQESDYGKFVLSAGKFYGDPMKDQGLQTSQDARFHAFSARFKAFGNAGEPLMVQFTVKHEQSINCGGGYVKLFPADLNQEDMLGDSLYNIMFGPDICGPGTKKIHVLPVMSGQRLVLELFVCPTQDDEYTHPYTLILSPDNTYEVKIDNKKVESGSLEEDWDMLSPKRIEDPGAKNAVEIHFLKDWDKPEDIPDPDAKKPNDWDDEMDGEWEPPRITNPEYKGEWKPWKIDNPDYKGKWVHPKIDNPEYVADAELHKYDSIGVIGLDLLQVKSGTIFDNLLINGQRGSSGSGAFALEVKKKKNKKKNITCN
uniref:Calreticulin n=1 Tax=Scleropages formosus TaxID=113540 RepID=A0A8C9S4X2_SCLFO